MTQPSNKSKSSFRDRNRSNSRKSDTIGITLGGSSVKVTKKSFTGWQSNHGMLPGNVQVNSLDSSRLGDTTCIRDKSGNAFYAPTKDLVLFAQNLLTDAGYKVSAPDKLAIEV